MDFIDNLLLFRCELIKVFSLWDDLSVIIYRYKKRKNGIFLMMKFSGGGAVMYHEISFDELDLFVLISDFIKEK